MTHDHKQDSCCGGDKHHEHEKSKPEKEKDGCCGGKKDKKPETDTAEKSKTQDGGCCGGGHK